MLTGWFACLHFLNAAQRYAADYNGIIANGPGFNFTGVRLYGVKIGQAAYAAGASPRWLSSS
jgi:hypothetical protein